jgi:hypothetical protein
MKRIAVRHHVGRQRADDAEAEACLFFLYQARIPGCIGMPEEGCNTFWVEDVDVERAIAVIQARGLEARPAANERAAQNRRRSLI